jgi:hypothetical protein
MAPKSNRTKPNRRLQHPSATPYRGCVKSQNAFTEENKISTAGFSLLRGKREWVINKKWKFYYPTNRSRGLFTQPHWFGLFLGGQIPPDTASQMDSAMDLKGPP